MKHIIYYSIGIFMFFLSSCGILDYQPKGEHYVQVSKPPPIQIEFGVDVPNDTVVIWDQAKFRYTLKFQSQHPSSLLLYLDNRPINFYQKNNTVSFNTRNFENGFHLLSLVCLIKTESHSLADNLNMEFYSVKTDVPVIIDNRTFSGNFDITRIESDHSAPTIFWTEYPYDNYQELTLIRELKTVSFRNDVDTLAVIRDRTITHWTDSTYVCGKATYTAILKAKGKTFKSSEAQIEYPMPAFTSGTTNEDGTFTLEWTPLQYTYNFDRYIIKKGVRKYRGEIEWRDETPVDDVHQTSFVDPAPILGEPMVYYLMVESHGHTYWCDDKIVKYGKHIPYCEQVSFVPTLNKFCLFGLDEGGNYINYYFDENRFSLQKVYDYFIAFSPDGRLAFRKANSIIGDVVYRVKPDQPDFVLDTINMPKHSGSSTSFLYFSVTNNGYLAFVDHAGGSMVYDAINKKEVVYQESNASTGQLQSISSNGQYVLFSDGWMYRIAINKFQKLYQLSRGELEKFTFTEDGNNIIITNYNLLAIYNTSDKSPVRKFPISKNLYRITVDPVSHQLGGFTRNPQTYRIYDLQSGRLIKEIPVAFEDYLYRKTLLHWASNTLFKSEYHTGSYCMKINW